MNNYKRFTYEDRLKLKELLDSKLGICEIANILGYHHSTISREIKKGTPINSANYNPEYSQKLTSKHLKVKGRPAGWTIDDSLAKYISYLILEKHFSPRRIIEQLKQEGNWENYPKAPTTIYRAIDSGQIPNVSRETLIPNTTTMFSDGMIHISKRVLEKLNWKDGDNLYYSITDDNCILIEKLE